MPKKKPQKAAAQENVIKLEHYPSNACIEAHFAKGIKKIILPNGRIIEHEQK